MAIITQDGLFYGDRVKKLSLMAQLYWPRFFVASNTCGRIELNYEKLTATAFASLPVKPTMEEFWGYVGEYYTAHLLFTYDSEGQIWGQWDTDPALLPRHKLQQDLRTPEPPKDAWDSWIEQYKQRKFDNRPKAVDCTLFVLPAKNCAKVPKDSEILQKVSRGVGVGVGVGEARQGEAKATTPQAALPDWIPLAQWNAFVDSRKKLRSPMTVYAQELLIKKLESARSRGQPIDKMLERAIEGGWKTVYDIDGNHQQQPETKMKSAADVLKDRKK